MVPVLLLHGSGPGTTAAAWNPLVEALEPGGEQRELGLLGQLLDERLVERPALRRERYHPRRPLLAVDRLERGRDDVDAEHHARAAAVGLVVDLACAQRRRVAG